MHICRFRDMHGMIGHLCILKSRQDQAIQLKVTIHKKSLDSLRLMTNKKPIFSFRKNHSNGKQLKQNSLLQSQLEETMIFHLLRCQLMRQYIHYVCFQTLVAMQTHTWLFYQREIGAGTLVTKSDTTKRNIQQKIVLIIISKVNCTNWSHTERH